MIRSIHRLVTAGAATALVAGSLLMAPVAASASTTGDAPADGECHGARLALVWAELPEELRADLKALRNLPADERRDAARDIREGARDGEYGEAVQDHAQRIHDRRIWRWSTMDETLKADLREIAEADAADRPALVDELAENALAGEYGDRAQRVAERLQERC